MALLIPGKGIAYNSVGLLVPGAGMVAAEAAAGGTLALAGTLTAQTVLTGALSEKDSLAAIAIAQTLLTGELSEYAQLVGTVEARTVFTGALKEAATLAGVVGAVADVLGDLDYTTATSLAGVVQAVANVTGETIEKDQLDGFLTAAVQITGQLTRTVLGSSSSGVHRLQAYKQHRPTAPGLFDAFVREKVETPSEKVPVRQDVRITKSTEDYAAIAARAKTLEAEADQADRELHKAKAAAEVAQKRVEAGRRSRKSRMKALEAQAEVNRLNLRRERAEAMAAAAYWQLLEREDEEVLLMVVT